ncbi:MAG TPA: DUF1501 domain-containing protein [Planctomycetota bacterium]|nr:DUF1501 domain-containing protein [Planctomycetota bacterium]
MSRRAFLGRSLGASSACAFGAASLSSLPSLALRADELRRAGTACILLWMQGGPSQLETFDPKPDHPNGGPTTSIQTSVPGIHLAEHFPTLAREMKEVAVIRSMTNREGNHQRATYQLHTGYLPTAALKHPTFGSIVACEKGHDSADLPSFVAIGRAGGGGGRLGGGFLGVRYDPFELRAAGRTPADIAPEVSPDRFTRRLRLLDELGARTANEDPRARDHLELYHRAARLSQSPRLDAFDLDEEPAAIRDAYGDSEFGRGALLARRLVEVGVPFVEVRLGGWDTHQDNFERSKRLALQVDLAFAQLIRDLRVRGLLESTLIVWMGEFGRTPRINPRGGRDHFPRAFNVALAGAGIAGGRVIGRTTRDGMDVDDRPVTVPDLFATICRALHIDPAKENAATLGRPVPIVTGGAAVDELFG